MTTKTPRARLDADKTAKPKTRLVRKHPANACVGPSHGAEYIEDENGKRTPLHSRPKPMKRDVLLHVVDVPVNGEGRIYRSNTWTLPVSLLRITRDGAAEVEIAGRHFYVDPESLTDLAGNPLEGLEQS